MYLQSALQSITHQFPPWIVNTGRSILGEACYSTLIHNADVSDLSCLRLAVSKALGIGIIIFGSILKIPQMITIIRHQSAHGVSLEMYALEVAAYDISLAYAYRRTLPFSTYGENASLTIQNMVITLMIIWYEEGKSSLVHQQSPSELRRRRVYIAASLMTAASIFLFVLCPAGLLAILQALSIPISCISKFPQIAELHRNKEPGHLSAIVVFAQLAGTLARVFTTVTETGDWLIGIGFGLASVLNTIIVIQYVLYWNGAVSGTSTRTSLKRKPYGSATTLPLTTLPGNRTQSRGVSGAAQRLSSLFYASMAHDEKKNDDTQSKGLESATVTITLDDSSVDDDQYIAVPGHKLVDKGHRKD